MPTYEYECTKCGHVFEMMQSIRARPKTKPDEPCENCGRSAPIRRLIGSGGAVILKGHGFYQTDYRSESYKKAAEADKKEASKASSEKSAGKNSSAQSDTSEKTAGKAATPST